MISGHTPSTKMIKWCSLQAAFQVAYSLKQFSPDMTLLSLAHHFQGCTGFLRMKKGIKGTFNFLLLCVHICGLWSCKWLHLIVLHLSFPYMVQKSNSKVTDRRKLGGNPKLSSYEDDNDEDEDEDRFMKEQNQKDSRQHNIVKNILKDAKDITSHRNVNSQGSMQTKYQLPSFAQLGYK